MLDLEPSLTVGLLPSSPFLTALITFLHYNGASTSENENGFYTQGSHRYEGSHRSLQKRPRRTMEIVAPLEIEDYVIQTAEFMSPPRWHIGHTSWFFETVLQAHKPGFRVYSEDFLFYFNSYYEGFGVAYRAPEARHEIAADS